MTPIETLNSESGRNVRSDDAPSEAQASLSIVIPTLNEQDYLRATLEKLRQHFDGEVVIVDGGSVDETVQVAKDFNVVVICSQSGRGKQMNVGAAAAGGDALLFLHADTFLPDGFAPEVHALLHKSGVSAGAFRLQINSRRWSLRFIAACANLRSRVLNLPYGDQALFLKREMFERIRGFPAYDAMEDFCFVRRLRKHGRITISRLAVTTSARRWELGGPWRMTVFNQLCVLAYTLGIKPNRIARWRTNRSAASTAMMPSRDQSSAPRSTTAAEQRPAYTR